MRDRRGFTLVEIIVVLVILAVIAGIIIPGMTKYIDVANGKKTLAECADCVSAAQSLLDTQYAASQDVTAPASTEITALAHVDGDVVQLLYNSEFRVTHLMYSDGEHTAVYCNKGGCSECGMSQMYTLDASLPLGTQQQQANDAFAALALAFANSGFASTKIDGVNAETAGTFAYTIFHQLSAQQQSFLRTVSWSVVRSSFGYRIYFTDTNYGTASADRIKVYKYNMDTAQYQYTLTGRVTDGMVTSVGSVWSDWSDTMD